MSKSILLPFTILYFHFVCAQIDGEAIFSLPSLTTTEINAATNVLTRSLVYNSDNNTIYKYTGSSWEPVGATSPLTIAAGSNITITGSGTAGDPFTINTLKATMTDQGNGTYLFSNGIDADIIVVAGSGNTPIVSSSNATGSCANSFGQNETRDVIIQGDFFDGSATVTISGQTVNSVTVNSAQQITANVTASSTIGSYDIQVGTNSGVGVLPNGFSIKEALTTYSYASGQISLTAQMSYNSGSLRRTGGNGWNRSGYSTVYGIPSGSEGYIEFEAVSTNRNLMIGLDNNPSANNSYTTIDYAFYITNTNVRVYENGANRGVIAANYAAGDVFRIYVGCNGTVSYYMNGNLLYTSNTTTSNTLYLDSSFYNGAAELTNFSITY